MSYVEPLLSRIIDENNVPELDKLGLSRDYFHDSVEQAAYDFIRKYHGENGQAPSYAAVVTEVPDFTYVPAVTDSYEFMARRIKETWAQTEIQRFMQSREHADKFAEIGHSITFDDYAQYFNLRVDSIKMRTEVRKNNGVDVAAAGDLFLAEYERRKSGESFKIWKSAFPSVNAAIGGGYFSGNMYTWFGRSGRGKSIVTLVEALEAAVAGACVIIWAMEMPMYEILTRIISFVSARIGVMIADVDGMEIDAGFDNRAMLAGKLPSEIEADMEAFVKTINEHISGRIIVRAVDDPTFIDRSVRALEREINEVKADVVVIDPIYYMDYERNTSKTAGGDVAATSVALRRLAGRTQTVIHVITQSDEDEKDKTSEARELKPPSRSEVKKTKAVLEDATVLFAFDSLANEGRGKIALGKGRAGGEDTTVEVVYLPNYGIVREPKVEDIAAQFVGNF